MDYVEQNAIFFKLKQTLKKQGVTYENLSIRTGIPVSTLKKIFTGRDCSFSRVIEICHALNLSFFDLTRDIESERERVFSLSLEQEIYFSKNFNVYLVFHKMFRDNFSVQEVQKHFAIEDAQMWRIVRKLEKFELIEILDFPKIRFKVSGALQFLKDGPLQEVLSRNCTKAFAQFITESEEAVGPVESPFFRMQFGRVSTKSYAQYLEEIKTLHEKYVQISAKERKLANAEDLIDVTWLFGVGQVHGIDLAFKK